VLEHSFVVKKSAKMRCFLQRVRTVTEIEKAPTSELLYPLVTKM
jgi:hypothetical protein